MNWKAIWITAAFALSAFAGAAGLTWAKSLDAAMKQAKTAKKVVMVDFTAVWCVNCHKLERTTYKDPAVLGLLSKAVPVQIDYDKQTAIAKRYKVEALPVILFLDSSGKELGRISKYVDAKEFVATATPMLAKAKKWRMKLIGRASLALALVAVASWSVAAGIKWRTDLAGALKIAKKTGKPVMIDFYGET